jgi:arginine repressor
MGKTDRTIMGYLYDLLQDKDVDGSTQEQLRRHLRQRYGVNASQASISRALKQLGLVRVPGVGPGGTAQHWHVDDFRQMEGP